MSASPKPPTHPAVPSRADAQRNRHRILDIALVELEANPDVALRTIAHKAGVGQGTLYRHFPDRETLLWAVYDREVQRLVDAASELLERLPPMAALHEWMRQLAAFAISNTNLGLAMHRPLPAGDVPASGHTMCGDAVAALLAANQQAGTVRPDLTSDDVLRAVAGIWQLNDPETMTRHAQAARLIDIVLAGISVPKRDAV